MKDGERLSKFDPHEYGGDPRMVFGSFQIMFSDVECLFWDWTGAAKRFARVLR